MDSVVFPVEAVNPWGEDVVVGAIGCQNSAVGIHINRVATEGVSDICSLIDPDTPVGVVGDDVLLAGVGSTNNVIRGASSNVNTRYSIPQWLDARDAHANVIALNGVLVASDINSL